MGVLKTTWRLSHVRSCAQVVGRYYQPKTLQLDDEHLATARISAGVEAICTPHCIVLPRGM
jgi:hypothetical protein